MKQERTRYMRMIMREMQEFARPSLWVKHWCCRCQEEEGQRVGERGGVATGQRRRAGGQRFGPRGRNRRELQGRQRQWLGRFAEEVEEEEEEGEVTAEAKAERQKAERGRGGGQRRGNLAQKEPRHRPKWAASRSQIGLTGCRQKFEGRKDVNRASARECLCSRNACVFLFV